MSEKWVWKKTDENSEGKMVKWIGPAQYEDQTTKTLMMLPTDYSLVQVSSATAPNFQSVTNENRTRLSRNGSKHTPTIRRNFSMISPPSLSSSSNWVFPSKVISQCPLSWALSLTLVLDGVKPIFLKKTENAYTQPDV